MSASIVSFIRRAVSRDWSTQELAEFYRVEAALLQAGMRVVSDRGVTDEGDPWFVFCRADDEEVLIHFARIDGRYLISAPGFGGDATGYNFHTLVRDLVDRQPLLQAPRARGNVVLHPSALLVMLVATLLLKSGHAAEAAAAKSQDGSAAGTGRDLASGDMALIGHAVAGLGVATQESAAVVSAALFVAVMSDDTSMPTMIISAPVPQPDAGFHQAMILAPVTDETAAHAVTGQGSVTPNEPTLPAMAAMANEPARHEADTAAWQQQAAGVAPGTNVWTAPGIGGLDLALKAFPIPAMASVDVAVVMASPAALPLGSHDLAESLLKAFAGQQPIIHTDVVPDALATPLHQSAHTSASVVQPGLPHTVMPPTQTLTPPPTPPVVTTATVTADPVVVAPAVASDPTLVATVQPVQPVSAPVPQTWPDLKAVLAIMQSFAADVGNHLAVVVTGNQVIEYDFYAIDHNAGAVSAVTYDFPDGSHLSLVGLPSELPHAPH
jgi:hypothetical protein